MDRLAVDGEPVPVRETFEPFRADVRTGRLALLRTTFVSFSSPTRDDPLFRLAESGAGNVADLTTLCCLGCSARHSVNGIYARSLTGRPPLLGCQRCGCPDGVLLYDPAAATRADGPYDLRRLSGAGRRADWVVVLYPAAAPGPEVLKQVLDLASQGESFEGGKITTVPLPAGDAERAEGLALALVVREEAERPLAPGAAGRTRLSWLRFPSHGDLLVAVVTAPD